MFKQILLPVDSTDKHGPALKIAAELAGQSGGEIVLLHVIEVITGVPMEEEKAFYGRLERSARKHLEGLNDALSASKVKRRGEILYGNRPREITRFAVEAKADLIVLTTPRPDPANVAASWGSLSWKLGLLAPCAVLLVK